MPPGPGGRRPPVRPPRALLLLALLAAALAPAGADEDLLLMAPWSDDSSVDWKAVACAAHLAVEHVNARDTTVTPQIASLGPDLQLNPIWIDSQNEEAVALEGLRNVTCSSTFSPRVVVGCAESEVTSVVQLVASADDVAQISYASSASSLSDKSVYPLLARTITSDAAMAKVMVEVLTYFGWSRVAALLPDDLAGRDYKTELEGWAQAYGLDVAVSAQYTAGDNATIEAALAEIAASESQQIIALLEPDDVELAMGLADDAGLVGEGFTWVATDSFGPSVLTSAADRERLTGLLAGLLQLDSPSVQGGRWAALQTAYADSLPGDFPAEFDLPANQFSQTLPAQAAFAYDAVVAAATGLRVAGSQGSGQDVYDAIVDAAFSSASGSLEFDADGARAIDTVTIALFNWQPLTETSVSLVSVGEWTAAGLTLTDDVVFAGNTTTVPSDGLGCPDGTYYDQDSLVCTLTICALLPLTDELGLSTGEARAAIAAAVLLAEEDINARARAEPALADDVFVHVVVEDDAASASAALLAFVDMDPAPSGIVGLESTALSADVGVLGSVFEVPQLSFYAPADALTADGSDTPYFARLFPAASESAPALLDLVAAMGWTRIALVVSDTPDETVQSRALRTLADERDDVRVLATGTYDPGDGETPADAVAAVAASGAFVVVALVADGEHAAVLAAADDAGLVGDDFAWVLWAPPLLELPLADAPLAQQAGGLFVRASLAADASLEARWGDWVGGSSDLGLDELSAETEFNALARAAYDAVWMLAAGISSVSLLNATDGALVVDAMQTVQFEGASGTVAFDDARSRANGTFGFEVINVQHNASAPVVGWASSSGSLGWNVTTAAIEFADGSSAPPLDALQTCELGYRKVDGECEACAAGTYYDNATDTCVDCAAGEYQPAEAQTSCLLCAAGAFSAGAAAECSLCAAGEFAAEPGAAACERCPVTGFAADEGAANCTACPANAETPYQAATSADECLCLSGFYLDDGCLACPEGGSCDGGLAPAVPAVGYWASEDEPTVMYLCLSEDVCPGGAPETCAGSHTGTLCSDCEPGYYQYNSECITCTSADGSSLFLSTLFLYVSCYLFYRAANARELAAARVTMGVSNSLGMLISFAQVVAVFQSFAIPWPTSVSALMAAFSVFNLNLSLLQLECSAPFTFVSRYTLNLVVPMAVAFMFVSLWAGSHAYTVFARRHTGAEPFREDNVAKEREAQRMMLEHRRGVKAAIQSGDSSAGGGSAETEMVAVRARADSADPVNQINPMLRTLALNKALGAGSVGDLLGPAPAAAAAGSPAAAAPAGSPAARGRGVRAAPPAAVASPAAHGRGLHNELSTYAGHADGHAPGHDHAHGHGHGHGRGHARGRGRHGPAAHHGRGRGRAAHHGRGRGRAQRRPTAMPAGGGAAAAPSLAPIDMGEGSEEDSDDEEDKEEEPPRAPVRAPERNDGGPRGLLGGARKNKAKKAEPDAAAGRPPPQPSPLQRLSRPVRRRRLPSAGSAEEAGLAAPADKATKVRWGWFGANMDTSEYGRLRQWLKLAPPPYAQAHPLNWDKTINAAGWALEIMYLFMVKNAMLMFQCYKHPNGEWSLVSYPALKCYQAEWREISPLGAVGFLLYGVGIPVVFARVLYVAPDRSDRAFQTRTRFLVSRFRPSTWYWALLVMARKFSIAVIAAVWARDALAQITLTAAVLVGALFLQVHVWPFYHTSTNALDTGIVLAHLGVVLCAVALIVLDLQRDSPDSTLSPAALQARVDGITTLIFAIIALAVGMCFAAFGYELWHSRWVRANPEFVKQLAHREIKSFERYVASLNGTTALIDWFEAACPEERKILETLTDAIKSSVHASPQALHHKRVTYDAGHKRKSVKQRMSVVAALSALRSGRKAPGLSGIAEGSSESDSDG